MGGQVVDVRIIITIQLPVPAADFQPTSTASAGRTRTIRNRRRTWGPPEPGLPAIVQLHRKVGELTAPEPRQTLCQLDYRRPIGHIIEDLTRDV